MNIDFDFQSVATYFYALCRCHMIGSLDNCINVIGYIGVPNKVDSRSKCFFLINKINQFQRKINSIDRKHNHKTTAVLVYLTLAK